MSVSIYICRYNVDDQKCQWQLTEDKLFAQSLDPSYQIASIADLHDWVAATGETFNGILSVREGLCKWIEREFIDEFGEMDVEYGYVIISNCC
ncbi:hypothetical protein [Brevibacillus sp. NRS-1366]|uniref:hypothetical protein n=1 Tax=Brevibacillus sp. NRS-1366 TaxID=3233899 RepID=UPI003D24FAA0